MADGSDQPNKFSNFYTTFESNGKRQIKRGWLTRAWKRKSRWVIIDAWGFDYKTYMVGPKVPPGFSLRERPLSLCSPEPDFSETFGRCDLRHYP